MRRCSWCRGAISGQPVVDAGAFALTLDGLGPARHPRGDRAYCSKRCRQTAWRSRQLSHMEGADGQPRRLVYADPPYPGTAAKYYGDQPTFAGEVDHAALVARLVTYDGWALSTSQAALQRVLVLCPPEVRIASWVKPIGVSRQTRGPHNTWEPIIYKPARWLRPGKRDWIRAMPARGGGDLPGRKPIRVCNFVFDLLGAAAGDSLEDLFPGTEVVTKAWAQAQERLALRDARISEARARAAQLGFGW